MDDLQASITESEVKIKKVRDGAPAIQLWRRLSLTGDEKIAARSYRETLTELLQKHNVQELNFRDEQQKSKSTLMVPGFDPVTNKQSKVPLWTGINFQVNFKTKLANLVALVKEFQQLPMMHRIKTLTIERTDEKKEGELLTVVLSFEAIIILNADKIQDKAGFKDVSGLQKAEIADTLAGLRGAGRLWAFGLVGRTQERRCSAPQSAANGNAQIRRHRPQEYLHGLCASESLPSSGNRRSTSGGRRHQHHAFPPLRWLDQR